MDLLPLARQALAQNQLDRAIQLLLTASSKQTESPDIWFTLATALGRKGGQQAPCCIAYLRTLQLLLADEGSMQGPARAAVAAVAADNCWLLAEKLLPTAWPAALQDSQLARSMYQGFMHHLTILLQQHQQSQQQQGPVSTQTAPDADASGAGSNVGSHVQLLCVGGMGVQAMLLAAAASAAQGSAVEAAEAAAASAGANSSSSDACVPSMGLTCIPDGQLTAHIVSQLLADNDLDDIVDVCTWPEYMQQQREQERAAGVLALLAGAVQPNWGPAVSSCLKACHRLAAFMAVSTTTTTTSSSSSSSGSGSGHNSSIPCVLSPGVIKVWAVPVSCKELLELNEVDLPALSAHTTGHFNYAAANAALRRSSRAAQVSRHNPQLLAAPSLVLQLPLQELLQQLQQRYSAPQQKRQATPAHEAPRVDSREGPGLAGACVAAALAAGRPAEVTAAVKVQQEGHVDAVVWWLEFDWAPGHSMAFTPPVAAAACAAQPDGVSSHSSSSTADGSSSSSGDSSLKAACVGSSSTAGVLQPHVWQHVQYLPVNTTAAAAAAAAVPGRRQTTVTQGQLLDTGDTLLLHARATAEDLVLSLSVVGSSEAAATAPGVGQPQQTCTEKRQQQHQQQHEQPVAEPGREILPYHLSMLNDHARTVAYDRGIAGAVQQLLSQQCQQQVQDQLRDTSLSSSIHKQPSEDQGNGQQQQQSRPAPAAPVVLDVGCGTGLLSMMAATAAAAAGGSVLVTGCEREPVLSGVASALIVNNHLQQHITVVQKLSNKLTVADGSTPSAAAAAGRSSKSSGQSGKKRQQQQQQQNTADMPAKASLIVHEIFGTDPLSEHVLPALQQVQHQLAQPGAWFMPSRLRIIAAVAACPVLLTHLRIGATGKQQPQRQSDQSCGCEAAGEELPAWDLSSLLALQPRKLELQLDELQDQMLLLTAPQSVLELDFQQPIQLNGKQVVELPALQQPLLLGHWMQQQQQGSAGSITQAGIKPAAGSQVQGQGSDVLRDCVVVSWFEADCGAGGWLSTRPGTTQLGHWQQSVEFVGLAAAAAASCSLTSSRSGGSTAQDGNVSRSAPASFRLQASWSSDRVKFALLEH